MKKSRKTKLRLIALLCIFGFLALAKTHDETYIGAVSAPTGSVKRIQSRAMDYAAYAKTKGRLVYELCYRESYGCTYNGKCTYSKDCTERGTMQYKKQTWAQFCPDMDYYDGYQQIDCAARMVKDGKAYHWATFPAAKKALANLQ